MDISSVKKLITEVLSESETRAILKEKIEKLAAERAEEIADEKAQMLYDGKHPEELERVVERRIDKELSTFKGILSKYVNETVKEFIQRHDEDFKVAHDRARINYILESLATTLRVAGVEAEDILEGKRSNAQKVNMLEGRVSTLKTHLLKEQNRIRDLQHNDELKESTRVEELKNALIEESRKNEELEKLSTSLKRKNDSLNEENVSLNSKNKSLLKENNKIIQMGIIDELKSDLSLTESHKFENCAMKIPFSSRKEYVAQLKELKESIHSEVLNEVVPAKDTTTGDYSELNVPNSMKRFL